MKIIIKLKISKYKNINLSDQEIYRFVGLTSKPIGSHQFLARQLQQWLEDLIRPVYPPIHNLSNPTGTPIHNLTNLTDQNDSGFKILIPMIKKTNIIV